MLFSHICCSLTFIFTFSEQNDKPGYVVEWPSIHFCRRRQTLATYPKADGPPYAFCSVLLRMGFTYALSVTSQAVVSYTAFPPLREAKPPAVYFCCTVPGVASARRYLASCPVKPGLSSPAAFRHMQLRPFVLLGKLKASLPHFSRFVYGGEKIRSKYAGKTFQ